MNKLPSDPLTPAEWVIMKAVWNLKTCSAMDVHNAVQSTHGWASTTVKTLLSKLVQKGMLSTVQDGRRFLYQATQPSESLLKEAADSFLEKTTEDVKGQLLCYLVDKADLSDTDVSELQDLLDQYKRKQGNDK